MLPVVLFLAAILVVAETCAAEGLFAAVGDAVRRAGRGDPQRVLLVTFLAASLITAALSLDATVVLLTPVVAAAVAGSRSERPVVHACVRLANSASLLLPVSNLTNLLALPDVDLSFMGWLAGDGAGVGGRDRGGVRRGAGLLRRRPAVPGAATRG